MARDLCREIIANLTGRTLSDVEIERLERVVKRRADRFMRSDRSLSPNEALMKAAEVAVAESDARAAATKRTILLNEQKRITAFGQIQTNWGKQLGLGLRSLVTGTQRGVEGARVSAAGQQDAIRAELLGGFHAALKKSGQDDFRLFVSDALEDDIARGVWQLSQQTPDATALSRLNPSARRIAQIVYDFQELSRGMLNREGANVGKYAGRVFQAAHDPLRISAKQAEWMRQAYESFDLDRMRDEMGFDDTRKMLDSLYLTLANGLHLRHVNLDGFDPGATSNASRKLEQSRVVHYKDADAFIKYNRSFGYGTLREAVIAGLEHSAKAAGLIQVLGTNPGAFLNAAEAQLAKALQKQNPSAAEVKRFRGDIASAKARLREVDGSLDVPGNSTLATYSQGIRAVQTMASLGSSLISSFADLGLFMVSARHNGINVFQAAGAAVQGLFKGRSRPEQIELASALGVVFESLSGKMASRFSTDDGGRGNIARAQQLFFQLNGQTWWTDSLRFAAAEMLSHNLAGQAGKSFERLEPQLAKTLGLYGIDARGWDIARMAVGKATDGKAFITPDLIEDETVRRSLRAYFTDQNGYVMLTPDAETRYLTKLGTQKGTVAGEALRFMMQFKSYSIAFSQKMAGRELLSHIDPDVRGSAVWKKAMGNGAALLGFSQLILTSTIFGYLAMSMKDILKGKEPRDPSDPRTGLAALQQGGGLGIMGDFLFGVQNRVGGGLIASLAGPTAGDVEAIANIYFTGREAALDPEKQAKVGDDLFRLTYQNTPGNNLFYVRPILDYLVMWNLQETLNPGAAQRMERNAARQGQKFFISPTQRVAEQRTAP